MVNVRNLAVFFGALLPSVLAAPAPITKKDDIIPGKFIVTLKPGVDAAAAEAHLNWAADVHKRSFAKRDTAGIEKEFGIKDWKAYSGEFDEATIAEIKASPEVSSILDH
jgi:oryzin